MNTAVIQSMIDAIDKPAIFITPQYVIVAVNDAYRASFNEEIVPGSSKCHQISHQSPEPCDRHGEDCPLLKCQQTGRATSVVHVHQDISGKSHCDIVMKPVKDDDGMVVGFLEILSRNELASASSQQDKMIGHSQAFSKLLHQINKAAKSNISVLLQGETGTGKELVAQALHQASEWANKPMVVIECTGLSESLFESELFGHEKGAFTGATIAKPGLIEMADGGTVFFDEIGDVPLNMQVKLLRLLETHSFRPVGGLKPKRVEFRMICATHKNLPELIAQGAFRKDLYYRIAAFPIYLPSLAERKEDILPLAEHFLAQSTMAHKHFSSKAQALLKQYDYPGNIRELKNIVEHAALLSDEDEIAADDLPQIHLNIQAPTIPTYDEEAIVTLDEAQARYLRAVCEQFDGSPQALAQSLGLSLRTLYRKLQAYDIKLSSNR